MFEKISHHVEEGYAVESTCWSSGNRRRGKCYKHVVKRACRNITALCVGDGDQCVIETPGVYHLCEDVAFSAGVAIRIAASCVTLDLNGHTLDGSGSGCIGVLVDGDVDNVIVRNGLVKNTQESSDDCPSAPDATNAAVSLARGPVTNVTVEQVRAYSCRNCVAARFADAGSHHLTIRECRASRCNRGLWVDHVDDVVVERCTVNDSLEFAVLVGDVPGERPVRNAIVRDCALNNSGGSALALVGAVTNACVSDCVASEAGNNGFVSFGAAGETNRTSGIVFERCCAFDVRSVGVGMFFTDHGKVDDCTSMRTRDSVVGFGLLVQDSRDALVSRCSSYESAVTGVSVTRGADVVADRCISVKSQRLGIIVNESDRIKVSHCATSDCVSGGIGSSSSSNVCGSENTAVGIEMLIGFFSLFDTNATYYGNRSFNIGSNDYFDISSEKLSDATTPWQNVRTGSSLAAAVLAAPQSTIEVTSVAGPVESFSA